MKQLGLKLPKHGGKRRNAGRPRVLPGRPRVAHVKREVIAPRVPAHVTLRFVGELPTLRTRKAFTAVAQAMWASQEKRGMRVVHFSVQSNHVHLIVEGVSGPAMKGLGVRIARGLNRLLGRRGRVIGDRYHVHALETPSEVRNAVEYVLRNHEKHTGIPGADPFSSVLQRGVACAARTWLLRKALEARWR